MTTSRREHPTQSPGNAGSAGSAGKFGDAPGSTGGAGEGGDVLAGGGAGGDAGGPRRAPGGPRTLAQCPPSRYEPHLDGLFTYALSVLRDHDVATAVLGDVLALAERSHGRRPSGEPEHQAWLYALTRWSCLRRLTEERRLRHGTHGGRPSHRPPTAVPEPELPVEESVARQRHADLTLLAWPEAAGTTPEQREVLELAVRHTLGARQVAAVLGMDPPAARELLAAAACEVERTRAALSVVETGTCPTVTRLTGDDQVLLSTALRGELVRHVDDCPLCRRAAERAGAGDPWPGTGASPGRLPLVEAPRAAAYMAMLHAPRAARGDVPRFDRDGFPLDPKDRAARRERFRTRAVTTTVVATVVAAPVLALWAAYRAPVTGEGHRGASVTASEEEGTPGRGGAPHDDMGRAEGYERTGDARGEPEPSFSAGRGRDLRDVSVRVLSPGRAPAPGAGRLGMTAESSGGTTVLRLTAHGGGGQVVWSMWSDAGWLRLSRSSGTLAPGESFTVYVTIDRAREPVGEWTGRLGVSPSGAVVSVAGTGAGGRPTGPGPVPGGSHDPGPGPGPGPTQPPSTQPPGSEPPPTTPPTEPPSTPPTSDPPTPTPTPSTPPSSEDPAPSPSMT